MIRLARRRIAGRIGAVRRRSFATLMALGLLSGTLMIPIISYLSTQPAGAVANAVVPDSAITGFTPVQFPGNDDGT